MLNARTKARTLSALIATLIFATASLAQVRTDHVKVNSSVRWLSKSEAELTIRADIAEGLHIYAQSQPKPFLATKFTIESSPAIESVSAFTPTKAPKRMRHEQMAVELHEHEGTVFWRAKVRLTESAANKLIVRGTVFAQACETGRCYAPKTYAFEATADAPIAAAPMGGVGAVAKPRTAIRRTPIQLAPVQRTPNQLAPVQLAPVQMAPVRPMPHTAVARATATATSLNANEPTAKRPAINTTYGANVPLAAGLEASNVVADFSTDVNNDASNEKTGFSLENLNVQPASTLTAWNVLPLAFVAGFLLNFMPCVLPVVGLKLLSFVQQANSDRKRILLMNVAYTAGLLSVMLILATLASFAGLGWGEQFSSTGFTVTLSAIVFAFGLSFLGVWEIPLPGFVGEVDGKTKQEGYGGAFTKGILSTLLATPCSGPFLGAALAWAVTQPTYLTYAVFTAVGLGMASPYLVIGLFPSAIRFLPKPGNWMVAFKQIMGFIMLATVVYLMSFMPVAAVVPTVMLLLGIGFAVWQAGKTPIYAESSQLAKTWAQAALVIAVTAAGSFGWLQDVMQSRFERAAERWIASTGQDVVTPGNDDQHGIAWETYSKSRLEELVQSGQPVFIDFTADWCLTCKANEATAIETAELNAALRSGKVVALRADKTESNPEADALLRQLGNAAASIPFYAFFPADNPTQPILLDGVYATPEPFVAAAKRAAATDRQSTEQQPAAVIGMLSTGGDSM